MFAAFTYDLPLEMFLLTPRDVHKGNRAALISGAVVRRGRVASFLVFIVLWSTFVYNPIARWTWNPQGWSYRWGTMDFAGKTNSLIRWHWAVDIESNIDATH